MPFDPVKRAFTYDPVPGHRLRSAMPPPDQVPPAIRAEADRRTSEHSPIEPAHGPVQTPKGLQDYEPGTPYGTWRDHTDADGEYSPERQRLHDRLVRKYVHGVSPADTPTVVVMGGGPAAGKSTTIRGGHVDASNHATSAPDDVKEDLPEYKHLVAHGDPTAAAYVHEESTHVGKRVIRHALSNGMNVLVDGTGDGSLESLAKKVAGYREAGAKRVVAEYVTVPLKLAHERAEQRGRETGRYLHPVVIDRSHAAVSRILPEVVKSGLFDEARLWDTAAGPQPVKVMEHRGGKTVIHRPDLWQAFLDKGEAGQVTKSMSERELTPVELHEITVEAMSDHPGRLQTPEAQEFRRSMRQFAWEVGRKGGVVDTVSEVPDLHEDDERPLRQRRREAHDPEAL